ncbi:MAG TPA: GAF domain-containing protein [Actinocrinis sp.]|uniref:sensor histidine kinase n=1 Tax=Actinocrinis sp. TaxID=1920516 RepID=UPI002D6B0A12|nr:GAF domain-containing protein [Actinocrinis sp.]HZU54280.1 GAF domain-containing protein [Actinocrinis sp.]
MKPYPPGDPPNRRRDTADREQEPTPATEPVKGCSLADAVLAVAGEPEPEAALRRTVEKAMILTSAQHGAVGEPPAHALETTWLGTPIPLGATVYTQLYLTDKADGTRFTAQDEIAAGTLARAAGLALGHASEREHAQLERRRLTAIGRLAGSLLAGEPPPVALEALAEQARELADADLVTVTLPDEDGVHQILEVAVGQRAELVRGLLSVREGSATGEVLRTGRAAIFPDVEAVSASGEAAGSGAAGETGTSGSTGSAAGTAGPGIAADRFAELGVGPALLLPMGAEGRVRGVLAVCRRKGRAAFEPAIHASVAELARQAAQLLNLADRRLDDEWVQVYQDRERIARDLHDLVVQRLFGVCLSLEGARNRAQRGDVAERIGQSIDELDDTIRQIRSTIFALQAQGATRPGSPLRHRIIQEVDAARQVLGFSAALRMEGLIDTDVPPAVAENVIAVLREALANVARHAQARRVEVDVAVSDRVTIEIVDDGLGPPASLRRSGLANLARRAEQFAGELKVEPVHRGGSGLGTGTRISWQVPLR